MGKYILLIEDNPDNREIVETSLKKEGFKVFSAKDGEEGLKMLEKNPSLVLLDMSLPKISGWDLIKKIREENRVLPVIALTAHAMAGDRERILQSGCNDYLSKPCLPKDIVKKVRKWLEENEEK